MPHMEVAAFPEGMPQCTSAYQASTSVTFADTPLVKASHMATSRITVRGVYTRDMFHWRPLIKQPTIPGHHLLNPYYIPGTVLSISHM